MDNIEIRSYSKGLSLRIKEDAAFEDILNDASRKFNESRKFFGSASVAISFEGKKLTESEEDQIVDIIRTRSDLNVVCTVGRDSEIQQMFYDAQPAAAPVSQPLDILSELSAPAGALIVTEDISKHNHVETDGTVIIYGDVRENGYVSAGGSVIVLGDVYGGISAGKGKDSGCFIYANDFKSDTILLCSHALTDAKIGGKLFGRKSPQIIYIENGSAHAAPFSKEHIQS